MLKVIINTDGGSRGNPGPAALGFIIKNEQGSVLKESGEYLGIQTNNFAEYTALVRALEESKKIGATDLFIQMDSELIVKQMTGIYKIKQPVLITIATKVKNLLKDFNSYNFTHIRREFNKEADAMVNQALDAAP